MAKVQETRITHEEIEAKIGEFEKKLEVLRVRYEQYFMGIEKVAPAMLRMDVTRIMRELEQLKIKNTSLKFRLRQGVQKFTSYSTYWNRVMREIEEGTYKKHVDKAKRHMAAATKGADDDDIDTEDSPVIELPEENIVPNHAATQAVSDEAEAFLSSIGLGTKRQSSQLPQQTRTGVTASSRQSGINQGIGGAGTSGAQPNVVRPAFLQSASTSGTRPAYQPQQPAYQQPGYQPVQPAYQQPGYQPQQPAYQQPGYQPQQPAYQQPGYQPQQQAYQRQQPMNPTAVRSPAVQRSAQGVPSVPPKLPPRPGTTQPGVVRPTAVPNLPNIPGKS